MKRQHKLTCPCCRKERSVDDLSVLSRRAFERGAAPCWSPQADWAIARVDASDRPQWACRACFAHGRALEARPWLQTFCDHPPYLAYFDRTQRCSDCESEFVFSATEQRYWYETLKFWVQSRPLQCARCRRLRRDRRKDMLELERIASIPDPDAETLARIAYAHLALGHRTQAVACLRRAKNLTRDQSRRAAWIAAIEKLIAGAPEE